MTLDAEVRARIRRLFHAEHWKIGTIATELGIHHDAVEAALEAHRFVHGRNLDRPSIIDPYKAFIREVLQQHPRLRASRLFEMIRSRGYPGSAKQLRRYVRGVRPIAMGEAFFRLETIPGEQGQVDWGHFGKIRVGRAERRLSCFVMVLGHSRAMYARFSLDQSMESFLRGHVAAFEALGGVPRTILYDNLKSVVLERVGDHVRFHPTLLELAGHYHFNPKPCAPYRANEKGKVERAIQYLRHAFFEARPFSSVAELNIEVASWVEGIAHQRIWPADPEKKRRVTEVLADERPLLLRRPEHDFGCDSMLTLRSGKAPYLRFDLNDYSIPAALVRQPLCLVASEYEVRILKGAELVAKHPRSWSRGEYVNAPEHFEDLAASKRRARDLRGRDRLRSSCPSADEMLARIVTRDEPVRTHTAQFNRLLDRYGADAVEQAMRAALARDSPSASSVAHLLDQDTRRKKRPPPLETILPDDPRVRDLHVAAHDLAQYDDIGREQTKEEESK